VAGAAAGAQAAADDRHDHQQRKQNAKVFHVSILL
jgi:hypothetical protein